MLLRGVGQARAHERRKTRPMASASSGGAPRRLNHRRCSNVTPQQSIGAISFVAEDLAPQSSDDWASQYTRRLIICDSMAVTIGAAVGLALCRDVSELLWYVLVSVALLPTWLAAIALAGGYETRFLGVSLEEYRRFGKAFLILLSVVAIMTTVSQIAVSRYYLLSLAIVLISIGVTARTALRACLRVRRSEGKMMQRAVVIGRTDTAEALVQSLLDEPKQGLRPVAVCELVGEPNDANEVTSLNGKNSPLVAREALRMIDRLQVEVVVIAAHSDLSGSELRYLAWEVEKRDVEFIVAPGLVDVAGSRLSVRPSNGLALLHVECTSERNRHKFLKSLCDRLVAGSLIVLLAPILVATALAVKFTSPGPIIFTQMRIGRDRQPFQIFKFRTMVQNADSKITELSDHNDGNAVQFKMKKDPRVTVVGQFLRRYSIDELPQLFNVLYGTMSLVGPRPHSQAEVDLYDYEALRRLDVLPGMTGLWQVSGRSDLSWEDSVRLDCRYVDNCSPAMDLVTLARTAKAVFAGSGAY